MSVTETEPQVDPAGPGPISDVVDVETPSGEETPPDPPVEPLPSARDAVEAELATLPVKYRTKPHAIIALRSAARLDEPGLSAANQSNITRNLLDALDRLYARIPKAEQEDEVGRIGGDREERLARDRAAAASA